MNRRTTLMLTGTTLLGLAIAALPQPSFAQSDPFLGTWQLNLAKTKYSPREGVPPRSQTQTVQAEGQGVRVTFTGVGAKGNPFSISFTIVSDGMPHPVVGNPDIAFASTQIDAYTYIYSETKAGKLVEIGTLVLSQDGKTLTNSNTGNASGHFYNDILVWDKQ
jgi:hypothetical protein